ncbi:MAG: hypothetical protein MUF54_02675 [Polyangiaceae bacterium]|nr:hypothetical protein [Polyangiaceae bacterium]
MTVPDLLRGCGSHNKLIAVGDALMAPYELVHPGFGFRATQEESVQGLACLQMLARHFPRAVWLNPKPKRFWPATTIETIAQVFQMFPLTLEGLGDAVSHLTKGRLRAGH